MYKKTLVLNSFSTLLKVEVGTKMLWFIVEAKKRIKIKRVIVKKDQGALKIVKKTCLNDRPT